MKDKRVTTAVLLSLFIISILFWIIFPWGIDMEFHMLRIGELARELARGSGFPVYMFRDVYECYGYPIPIFYGEICLLPFALLSLAGLGIKTVYEIMILALLWGSFGTSYLCIKAVIKDKDTALAGAFIYAVQPYFLCELFVRASVGSAIVFVFVPVVILGIYYLDRDIDMTAGLVCIGAGMSGIITAHVVSAVLILIAAVILLVVRLPFFVSKKRALAGVALSITVCILLSSWYIWPMAEQLMSNTFLGQETSGLEVGGLPLLTLLFPKHLSVALSALTGFGIQESAVGGCSTFVIVMLIYHIATGRLRKAGKWEKVLYIIYFAMFGSLLMDPLWRLLGGILGFMQFSWRIYIVMDVVGVIAALCMMAADPEEKHIRRLVLFAILSAAYMLVFFMAYFGIRNVMPDKVGGIIGHEVQDTQYSVSTADILYIPVNVDIGSLKGDERCVRVLSGDIDTTQTIDEAAGSVYIDVKNAASDSVLECPFIMYSGYSAVNAGTGEKYSVYPGDNGLVCISLPEGTAGRITVSYTGTAVQRISFYVSLFFALCLILLIVVRFVKRRTKSEGLKG